MTQKIQTEPKSISEYLKLKKSENFVIPEYQRGYSWDITQCDQLWQDIEAFIEPFVADPKLFDADTTDPYFFGTIIIDCSEHNNNKYSLIDGQQRTTTFLLLLKALLIKLNEVIDGILDDPIFEILKEGLLDTRRKIMRILYKVEPDEIPAMLRDFKKAQNISVLENESINEQHKDELKIILEAVNFTAAEQKVSRIPGKRKDNKYTNQFKNFKYFYDKLNKKHDSELNLFARAFLGRCQVIEIRSWENEQAITIFNSLNSKADPLSDAEIISAKLYSKAGNNNKEEFKGRWENLIKLAGELETQKVVDIDAILMQFMYINRARQKEYLKQNTDSVDVTVPGVRRYYTDIEKKLLDDPLKLCEELLKIAQIWEKIKGFPVVKLLMKFNKNVKLYLAGYCYRYEAAEITEDKLTDVCECLLKLFTILELVDAGYSSAKFKTFLFRRNIELVDKKIKIQDIKKEFNSHIRDERNWTKDEIKEKIFKYDDNPLVYLNEYLYAKSRGSEFDFAENVNVEHIMPTSGKDIDAIQRDAEISDDEFDTIVNMLGNKILLEENINKSIGRAWFQTKKQTSVINKTGYRDSRYAIAKNLTKYPKDTWGKDDIITATEKAAARIADFIFQK
ncbi:MAG: DUF262 domain-containing protein [Treponemataceae bacterium]|nr:MAG: DUF262 domain-containing protein [Treponemataceae bacterium]GMO42521.1 MAG: DUF262 domain-containing protein [Treponemataceae bacterium]